MKGNLLTTIYGIAAGIGGLLAQLPNPVAQTIGHYLATIATALIGINAADAGNVQPKT